MGDPRLTSKFNVFACDARFHGWTTGGPRTEHTLENSAECIIATLVGFLRFFSLHRSHLLSEAHLVWRFAG